MQSIYVVPVFIMDSLNISRDNSKNFVIVFASYV